MEIISKMALTIRVIQNDMVVGVPRLLPKLANTFGEPKRLYTQLGIVNSC